MAPDEDGSESMDIHQFVKRSLADKEIDPEKHPHEAREAMTTAAAIYLLHADPETVRDDEYHYFTAVRIEDLLTEAVEKYHEEVEKYFTEVGEVSDFEEDELLESAKRAGRFTIGNSVTLTYSMAYELVEDLMRKLIPKILKDDLDDAAPVLLSQLGSYPGKADILRAASVIDGETRETIRHIKDVRDVLVHDVEERFRLSLFEELNEMNRIHSAISDLFEEVYGFPAYLYVDEA